MGYFSNGSEGEWYYSEYCMKCVHNGDGTGPMCPVWMLHLEHNYRDCNNDESILHTLIPRSEDKLGNEECKMFWPATSMGLPFGDPPELKP